MSNVLVTYATEHGSTRGIAERIATRLSASGAHVDLCEVTATGELTPYDAVVVGSAIHGGAWLPDASTFVQANAAVLRDRQVWLFSVSTLGDESSMFPDKVAAKMRGMRKETDEMKRLRAAVDAVDHHNFAGAVERDHWPATGRAFFRAMRGTWGDHRDWPAIDAWADRVSEKINAPTASRL